MLPAEGDVSGKQRLVPTLTGLSLTVKPGTLVAIAGRVGSGKSSVLAALSNEMEILSGDTGTH